MQPTPQIDSIRQAAVSALRAHGAAEPVAETILLRKLCVVGRKFSSGEMKAIWFFGTDAIEVIDGDGTVIERLPVEMPEEEKMAA